MRTVVDVVRGRDEDYVELGLGTVVALAQDFLWGALHSAVLLYGAPRFLAWMF